MFGFPLLGLKKTSGAGDKDLESLATNEKAPLLHSSPLPPPHRSSPAPSVTASLSGQRSFVETVEFSHLIDMDADITHRKTLPAVVSGGSDEDGPLLTEDGFKSEAEL